MRRVAAISALLASGCVLVGCGHSGRAAAPGTARTAGASTTARGGGATGAHAHSDESLAIARARAFARAVNLRASDLPGFRASSRHEHRGAGEKRLEHELLDCVGTAGQSRGLAEAGSGEFEREAAVSSQSVSSEVTVAHTPAQAAKELAAFHSGRLPRCLSRYFTRLLGSHDYHGARVSPVSTKQGSPPAPGATGSFGLRFTAAVTLHALRIPLYVDILGFVDGSAEVSLLATGLPAPLPAAIEERLFSLLLERARSHAI